MVIEKSISWKTYELKIVRENNYAKNSQSKVFCTEKWSKLEG